VELESLTSRPKAQPSLAQLVKMVSGKHLDKDLGDGALTDWTADQFSDDELAYAAADAYASLYVWQELERRHADLAAPESGTAGADNSAQLGVQQDECSDTPSDPETDASRAEDGDRVWRGLAGELRAELEPGGAAAEGPVPNDGDADGELPTDDEHDPPPLR